MPKLAASATWPQAAGLPACHRFEVSQNALVASSLHTESLAQFKVRL
jgi:hypothetical protein